MVPLDHIKVIELSPYIPASLCSMMLADFGAEVIKVEQPGAVDDSRHLWSYPSYHKMGAIYVAFNRNKRSVTIDLRKDQGREIFYKLCKFSDTIIEGFRPDVTRELGIGYEKIRKINKKIIYCSLTGYGQNSPHRAIPGHDLNFSSYSGILNLTGNVRGKPSLPGFLIADYSGSLMATIAILIALIYRSKRGKGQYIDISLLDSVISLMGFTFTVGFAGKSYPRGDTLLYNGKAAFYNYYKTKDGRFIAITPIERKFWIVLCRTLDREDLIDMHMDTKKQGVLKNELSKIFRTKTLKEWIKVLGEIEACFSPILTLEETVNSEHVKARGLLREVKSGDGLKIFKQIDNPINFSDIRKETMKLPPPVKGEHTEEILQDLGYSAREIKEFRNKGII